MYNLIQTLDKIIYKSTYSLGSYLQSTSFLLKNIIYYLQVLALSDLQSTMKILTKSTIYNLTSPPPPIESVFVQSICMGIVNEDEDIVIKRVKLEDDRKDTMRYWAHSQNLFRLE